MTKRLILIFISLWYLLSANTTFAQGHSKSQKDIDEDILSNYFSEHHLHPVRTQSGLYYIINRYSNGESPKPGQKVVLRYTGRTMDGKIFDSNTGPKFGHTEPLDFILGSGEAIKGWDVGVAELKVGNKATFYIPSGLAYGKQGRGSVIPPNSILIFDVELLEIQKK